MPWLLSQVTHGAAGVWELCPPSLLVGLVEIKSFLRKAVAEISSQLQKPGLRSSCERCCPAVTDTLVLPTQVAIWGWAGRVAL